MAPSCGTPTATPEGPQGPQEQGPQEGRTNYSFARRQQRNANESEEYEDILDRNIYRTKNKRVLYRQAARKIASMGGIGAVIDAVYNGDFRFQSDVAQAIGAAKRPGQVLVGFAAETEKLAAHAQGKLQKKNLDMIIANDVTQPGAGFDVDTNIVTVITADGAETRPMMSKLEVARAILQRVQRLRETLPQGE